MNLWKFTLEMGLAYIDIWDNVDKSEEPLPSHVHPKMMIIDEMCAKKAMSTITLNLLDHIHKVNALVD